MKIIKAITIIFILLLSMAILYHCINNYDSKKAAKFITQYSSNRSSKCCAGWITAAIIAGGEPCVLLRACDYPYLLPYIGFEEIVSDGSKNLNNYNGKIGDIVVFPATDKHVFGHIAMWNGTQWISDFKQKSFFCANSYRQVKYKIYRHI